MIEPNLSDHHQSEDNEFNLRISKRPKKTKTFGPDFLIYMLDNESRIYSKVTSFLKAFYLKEVVNRKIKSIMNNHKWELVDLSPISKSLGHKWIFKRKIKVDGTIDKFKLIEFFRKPPNNTDDFSILTDFVCKEQQLTMQLESEQFWSSLENSVGDSLCN
jgi:hypothetical protein